MQVKNAQYKLTGYRSNLSPPRPDDLYEKQKEKKTDDPQGIQDLKEPVKNYPAMPPK